MIYSNKLNKRFCYWRRGLRGLWAQLGLGNLLAARFGFLSTFFFFFAGHIACLWLHFIVSFSRSRLNQCGALPSPIAIVFSSISISATGFVYLLHLPFGPASSRSSSPTFCLCLVCCFSLSLYLFPSAFACLFCALLHFIISSLGPSTLCQARERVVIEFCVCILWSLQFMQR